MLHEFTQHRQPLQDQQGRPNCPFEYMPPAPQPMASCPATNAEDVQPPYQPGGFLRLQSAELREVPMHIRQHLQTLLLPPNASLRDVKAKPRLPHPATVEIGIYMWYHIVQACSSTVPGTKESMPLVRPLSAGRLQKARAEISSRQDPCRCQFRVDEILILGLWLEFCSLSDGLFNVLPCASLWRD